MEETDILLTNLEGNSSNYFGSKLENRRWWVLLSFGIFNAMSAMTWITYNSMTEPSMEYYDINESQVLWFSDTALYTTFIFSYILCWYAFKRFEYSFLFSVTSMAIATWIRYAAGSNYALALVGQIVTGIAGSSVFGLATLIPIRWFSLKERFLVTTISIYSNNLGWALGTIIGPILAQEDSTRIPLYLLIQAIITTVCLIISLLCVKERPKEPPSYSALIELTDPSTFWQEVKSLLKIPRFIPTAICFGILLGVCSTISTIGQMYLASFELSYLEQGIIQFSYVISGTITGLLGTFFLETKKLKNYDFIIRIFVTFSLLALLLSGVALWKIENPSLMMIILGHCFLGIGLIGAIPFLYSAIVEITFPIQDSLSSNTLFNIGQFFSLITGRLVIMVDKKLGLIILAIFMVPSWIYGLFIYKTDYKRRNADEQHKTIEKNFENSLGNLAKEEETGDQ